MAACELAESSLVEQRGKAVGWGWSSRVWRCLPREELNQGGLVGEIKRSTGSVPQLEEEERGRLGCVLQWRWLEVVRGAAARLSSIYRKQRRFAREKNLGGALCSTTAAQSVHSFDARQDDGMARAEAERCAEHPAARGHGTGVCCSAAHGTGEGHA
jgi:hypothetical protein